MNEGFSFDGIGDGPLGKHLKDIMKKKKCDVKTAVKEQRISKDTLTTYRNEIRSYFKFIFPKAGIDFSSKTSAEVNVGAIQNYVRDSVRELNEQINTLQPTHTTTNPAPLFWSDTLILHSVSVSVLCQDPEYENLVAWTSDYVNFVSSTSSTGGTSTLDNASAACTFFMICAGLSNPFHHSEVKHTRQSWARIKSQVGEVKSKAGKDTPVWVLA
jgi:hypothetical protein